MMEVDKRVSIVIREFHELSPLDLAFLTLCRNIRYGNCEVIIRNGHPAVVDHLKQTINLEKDYKI